MISFQQCKHVVNYYATRMTTSENIQVAPHVQRDCVHLNKTRGELCANIASNPILKDVVKLLHECERIEQVNSVPEHSMCFIDKMNIPMSSAGVQLIIHSNGDRKHICISKKYQKLCYSYFKLRHFDSFIEQYIKRWLSDQTWYVPKRYASTDVVEKILNSNVPQALHTHLIEAADVFSD